MKVYIASPFFNEKQLNVVKHIESVLDNAGIDFYSPRLVGVVADLKELKGDALMEETKRIYDSNIVAIASCDWMVGVVDDSDKGTMFEIGYQRSMMDYEYMESGTTDRKLITISTEDKAANLMLVHAVDTHLLNVNALPLAIKLINEGVGFPSQQPQENII